MVKMIVRVFFAFSAVCCAEPFLDLVDAPSDVRVVGRICRIDQELVEVPGQFIGGFLLPYFRDIRLLFAQVVTKDFRRIFLYFDIFQGAQHPVAIDEGFMVVL